MSVATTQRGKPYLPPPASPPPPKPSRGVIPPPYRQPPPPPIGENDLPPASGTQSSSGVVEEIDQSHVYKNLYELKMYSENLPPSYRVGGVAKQPVSIPTIPTMSRVTLMQQEQRQVPSTTPQLATNPSPEKPAVTKKPGFIQQRLRSLLPNGLGESKRNESSAEPRNNATRNEVDPLLPSRSCSVEGGLDNPVHYLDQTSKVQQSSNQGIVHANNGCDGDDDLPSPSVYYKDWSNPPHFLEDADNTAKLRSTCTKLFQRDSPANYSNIQTCASIMAKNTATSQEFDKVGQKEGVMKQLEQLESRHYIKDEIVRDLNDRRTVAASQRNNVVATAPEVESGQVEGQDLLPEHTYTMDKRNRLSHTENSNLIKTLPKNVKGVATYNTSRQLQTSGQLTPGSLSSGVYTMTNSPRNSDSTSTTSPEPESRRNGGQGVDGQKQGSFRNSGGSGGGGAVVVGKSSQNWNDVDAELKKIIHDAGGSNAEQSKRPDGKDDGKGKKMPPSTPPLPPLSPENSPTGSRSNSPKLHPKSKYKLSLSTTVLNRDMESSATADLFQRPRNTKKSSAETKRPANTSGGNRVRRTTTVAQGNAKQWEGPKSSHHYHQKPSGSGRSRSHHDISQSSKPPWQQNKIAVSNVVGDLGSLDPDVTSTTTGLDMDSLLDGPDTCYSSDGAGDDSICSSSQIDSNDMFAIRKQLEGLESMYSEVLKMLGGKSKPGSSKLKCFSDQLKASNKRRVVYGSLSSLSVASRGQNNFQNDRNRLNLDKRRSRTESRSGGINKRFQRLESHVVTLARSVAHLSSEMRSQHMMYQEIENLRRDMEKMREEQQHRHSSSTASSPVPRSSGTDCGRSSANTSSNNRGRQNFVPVPRQNQNVDNHRHHTKTSGGTLGRFTEKNGRISLANCSRIKKLTKFFGAEPPLLRQFLKSLGYEKYATKFETEGIGLTELPYLTDERFQKLGIPMGPRMRIMQESQLMLNPNEVSVYII